MTGISVIVRGVIAVAVRAGMGMRVLPAAVPMALPVEKFVLERWCVWHAFPGWIRRWPSAGSGDLVLA